MPLSALLLLNKPFRVLTQFTSEDGKATLRDFIHAPGMRPAGRLDYDSEGLVLLTDSGALQTQLADPRWKQGKTYFVQVEGEIDERALERLRRGVALNDGPTLPAEAERVEEPEWLWPRNPPIRFRKEIPTSWLKLTIREGRNRQVRRMTAAVNFPTLRLIRFSVGPWTLAGLDPGQSREVTAQEIEAFLASITSRPPRSNEAVLAGSTPRSPRSDEASLVGGAPRTPRPAKDFPVGSAPRKARSNKAFLAGSAPCLPRSNDALLAGGAPRPPRSGGGKLKPKRASRRPRARR